MSETTKYTPACGLCGTVQDLLVCSRCRTTRYCCKEHQQAHWKQHKPYCKKVESSDSSLFFNPTAQLDTQTNVQTVNGTGRAFPSEPSAQQQPRQDCATVNELGQLLESLLDTTSAYDLKNASLNLPFFETQDEQVDNSISGEQQMTPAGSYSQVGALSAPDPCSQATLDRQFDNSAFTLTQHVSAPLTIPPTFEQSFTPPESISPQPGSISPQRVASQDPFAAQLPLSYNNSPSRQINPPTVQVSPPPPLQVNSQAASMPTNVQSQSPRYQTSHPHHHHHQTGRDCALQPNAQDKETKIADYVVRCLNNYGLCVVDNFMGQKEGMEIFKEACVLDATGVMTDGQLVSQQRIETTRKIREDKIAWIEKGQQGFEHVGQLIGRLDSLIMQCNGRLEQYNINGRTQAMVACYPGHGTSYLRHVDNPNQDGRCITCIYYLNRDWDVKKHGGLLRIYPAKFHNKVADVDPIFDRVIFFWSDYRNPHEVQPAMKVRYAITVWYFDAEERAKAKLRYSKQGGCGMTLIGRTS